MVIEVWKQPFCMSMNGRMQQQSISEYIIFNKLSLFVKVNYYQFQYFNRLIDQINQIVVQQSEDQHFIITQNLRFVSYFRYAKKKQEIALTNKLIELFVSKTQIQIKLINSNSIKFTTHIRTFLAFPTQIKVQNKLPSQIHQNQLQLIRMGCIILCCCPTLNQDIDLLEISSDLITTIKKDDNIHFAVQKSQIIFGEKTKKNVPFKTRKEIPKILVSAGEAQYSNYIEAYNKALQTNSMGLVNLLKLCIDNSPQITSNGQNKQISLTQLKYTQPKELVNLKCFIYLFACAFAYQQIKKLTKQKYKQILKATGMTKKICQPFCKSNPQKIVFKGGRGGDLHRGLDGPADVQVGQILQFRDFSATYAYSNRLQDVRNSRFFYSFQLDSEDPHHYMIPKEEYTENNQQQIIVFPFITLQVVEKTIQKDFGRYILRQHRLLFQTLPIISKSTSFNNYTIVWMNKPNGMLYFDMSLEKITTFTAPHQTQKDRRFDRCQERSTLSNYNIDFGLNKCKTLLENNFKKYDLIRFKNDIQRIQLKTGEQNCSNFIEALNQVLIFYSLGQQISQNHACIFHLQNSKISSKDANTKKIIIKQQKPQ